MRRVALLPKDRIRLHAPRFVILRHNNVEWEAAAAVSRFRFVICWMWVGISSLGTRYVIKVDFRIEHELGQQGADVCADPFLYLRRDHESTA